MYRYKLFSFILFLFLYTHSFAQKTYTQYDYLHGKLNANRSWFDVTHYDIHLAVNPDKKSINGFNTIRYKTLSNHSQMQIDLWWCYTIDSIVTHGKHLSYQRDSNVIIIQNISSIKNVTDSLTIFYHGHPPQAKKAPWDGGFVWARDSNNRHWVGLACEGMGASCWLPCKDHLSDEPDSMTMHLEVPDNLVGVSNGQLLRQIKSNNQNNIYVWHVSNPINPYNITINIGDYVNVTDKYFSPLDSSSGQAHILSYYVLRDNKQKAEAHFTQTIAMLSCFEQKFGTYAFWKDGYKLVETPYWGMEHQSCVAYGSNYQNNEWGFDFIIIHESGHEWFGNNLSCADPADMWLHESFTTYSESVFMECLSSRENALKYLLKQREQIRNKKPMIGDYDVYFHARTDNDIYYKGTWVLHTLRCWVNNDTLWYNCLKDLMKTYGKKTTSSKQVEAYLSNRLGLDLKPFFKQYLYSSQIPTLEYKLKEKPEGIELRFRWINTLSSLNMPVKITLIKGKYELVYPTTSWQVMDLNYFDTSEFKVDTNSSLISIKKTD
jgi:aminopeptidase N